MQSRSGSALQPGMAVFSIAGAVFLQRSMILGTIEADGDFPLEEPNRGIAMNIRTIALAAVLANSSIAAVSLTSTAFAQSVGEKTGVNSAVGIAPKTEDFIKEAAMSDMLEIGAAKIAQQKGNAAEKKFAEQMIADHTKTSNDLKGPVAGEMKAAIPTVLDDASQKKLDKLRAEKPEDFAGQYDPMQVNAHKDAVSLFERYAKGGDDPKLKDWAGKTLPALQHHLEMAQYIDKNRK